MMPLFYLVIAYNKRTYCLPLGEYTMIKNYLYIQNACLWFFIVGKTYKKAFSGKKGVNMYPIKDFMTTSILSVDIQTSVEVAAKLMSEKKISSLLVKEGEEYVGIVTKTDFVKKLIAEDRNPKTTNIDCVMSKPFFSLDEYVQRGEASEFMLRKKIKHLVVTHAKKVVGILTAKDMLS